MSKVSFIANRQQAQNQYKIERWKTNPVSSGAYLGKHRDPILECATSDDVWQFVMKEGRQNTLDMHNAIRKAISLDDLELCWRLFEYAKSKFIVDADVYVQMLWILNHSDIYRNEAKAHQIYRQLLDELDSFKIIPTYRLFTAIFSCLTRYQLWDEAHSMWRKLKDAQHELLYVAPVWNSYVHLNIKQCLIEAKDNKAHLTHVLQLLDEMFNVYEVRPNDITYGSVISAVSKLLKRTLKFKRTHADQYVSNVDYIAVGEHLFEQCRQITGHDPYSNVYATMIDLYSNTGNVEKCMQLLRVMIEKKMLHDAKEDATRFKGKQLMQYKRNGYVDDVDDWNERTVRSCFGSTIKAIINNEEMSYEEGWKLIDYILDDLFMLQCGLQLDIVQFGLLFHCHASFGKESIDMKKVKKLYKQMLKSGIKPNNLAMNNLTMVARLKYQENKKKSDKFAKFIVKEFHRHKIIMPRVLQVKLNEMMVYHDDAIKYMVRRAESV